MGCNRQASWRCLRSRITTNYRFLSVSLVLLSSLGALAILGANAIAVDTDKHCASWAAAGQCTLNRRYMLAKCGQSCNIYLHKPGIGQDSEQDITADDVKALNKLPKKYVQRKEEHTAAAGIFAGTILSNPKRIGLACAFTTMLATFMVAVYSWFPRDSAANQLFHNNSSESNPAPPPPTDGILLPSDASGGTGEAGHQLGATIPTDTVPAILHSDVSQELEHSLAIEGQSLRCAREELEQLRTRLKSRDMEFDKREGALSASERRVAADAFALREQAQRQEQQVDRLVKRGAQLESDAARLRAELEAEREASAARVCSLQTELEEQQRNANARMLELEKRQEAAMKATRLESDARICELMGQLETQRREANARIMELETQQEAALGKTSQLQAELLTTQSGMANVKAMAEMQAKRLSIESQELKAYKNDLQERGRAVSDRERKTAAEVAAVSGQADSQRQAYFRLVEESSSMQAELGPLRAGAAKVQSLQEELERRSLAMDAREEELGIMARDQSARARKDEAEIVALRSQATSQAESRFKLLEENTALRRQLQELDDSSCHVRKCE